MSRFLVGRKVRVEFVVFVKRRLGIFVAVNDDLLLYFLVFIFLFFQFFNARERRIVQWDRIVAILP